MIINYKQNANYYYTMIAKPIFVKAIEKFIIFIRFSDNKEGNIDLSHLAGHGIFKEWDDNDLFFKVYINTETDAISWSNEIELCPNSLYLKLCGISFEQWKQLNLSYASDK
ncbi:MAG: DUF2442 domain-containing protein [Bacteroidia bacterium]|nr:DUF2442 domain-containing protein [Bacteroidia bacterium]